MQSLLGWLLIVFPGILYAGQLISSVSFPLAQRLGLQEDPNETDAILQRAERYAAYWDLVTMIWMPLAGVLMAIKHPAWPLCAFFGGAVYFDAAGREAAKILSFKHEGIRTGSPRQHRFFLATYVIMAVLAVVAVFYSVAELSNGL